jgi:hypothetical protein
MSAHQTDCHCGKITTKKSKIHPVGVPGFVGTNKELGQAIGRMRYDQAIEVLDGWRAENSRQGKNDHKLHRFCLSGHLTMLDSDFKKLIEKFQKIFAVCRPFMTHEFKKQQERKNKK